MSDGARRTGLAQRLSSAGLGLPFVLAVVGLAPAWLFSGVVLAAALVCQWELYRMFARVGVHAHRGPGLLCGGLVLLAFAIETAARPVLVPLALTLAVAGCLSMGLGRGVVHGLDWGSVTLTLVGVCYCAWLLGHVIWLRALPGGVGLTLLALGVTWSGETAAYAVGRRWGQRPLAPHVSPAKTVEGAVAQLLVSIAVGGSGVWALALPPTHAVAIGAMLGVIGQVGDLAESFLKRSAETKDTGGLVPGHGGLLDRLDSLLFNLPALYYYVRLFLSG